MRELFLTRFIWSSEKSEVFSSLWLIRSATCIQTVLTLIFGKNFSAVFHLKTGVRELFLTLFNWSSEKSEFFSSFWLIRSATSIQTVFTVIIGKSFSADFDLITGVRGLSLKCFFLVFWKEWSFLILKTYKECYLYKNSFYGHHWKIFSCWFSFKNGSERIFLTLFDWSSEKSEVFSTLCLIRSATPIQTVFTDIIGKNFSADFRLKTGVRELFPTLFNWSSGKSEDFSSLWLIRSATSIQTVFAVIIGKNFCAVFHLNTGVTGLFLTLFLGLLKRVKFFGPYD